MPERTDNVNGSRGSRNSKKHSFRNRSHDGRRHRHKKKYGKGGHGGGRETGSLPGMKGIPTVLGAKPVTRNGALENTEQTEENASTQQISQTTSNTENRTHQQSRSLYEPTIGSPPKTILTHSSKPSTTSSQKSQQSGAPTLLLNRPSSQEDQNKLRSETPLSPQKKKTTTSPLSPGDVQVLRQSKSSHETLSAKVISLHNNMELNLDSFFKQLTESKEFTVIGVLGPQGVGKSSLLCELAGKSSFEKKDFLLPFSTSSSNVNAETMGVDAYITNERVILLDCQPLFSPTLLSKLISSDAKLPTDVVSHENYIDLASTRLGLLMISICHVVITVLDGFDDLRTMQFIQTICMLHEGMFKSSHSILGSNANELFPANGDFKLPNIVFVVNKVPRSYFSPSNEEQFQQFLNVYFADTPFQKTGNVTPLEGHEKHGNVNFFQIPFHTNDSHDEYIHLSSQFTKLILSMSKRRLQSHSEKDWLQQSARIWENLKKSPFISEYNRVHQKLQLYKT